MVLNGSPLNFGEANSVAIPNINPIEAPPPIQTPTGFLNIPWDAVGAHLMEGSQRGLTARPVDAATVWWKNQVSPTAQKDFRTGKQIMDDYYDLGLNLGKNDRLSPEAEAFVVQQAADSRYRQSIIQGNAAQHPNWNIAGGFLGGLMDPIFTVPSLLAPGIGALGEGAAATGLLGRGAMRMAATQTAYGVGKAEAASILGIAENNLLTKPLTGLWGSRLVTGAFHGAAIGGGAYLATNPFSQKAGMHEMDPSEAWNLTLGGAAFGGVLHSFFGFIGDKYGLNTDDPRVQGAAGRAANKTLAQKLSGATPTPEANLATELGPEVNSSLGAIMDKIDGNKHVVDNTPDQISTEEPIQPESVQPVEPAAPPTSPGVEVPAGELTLPKDLRGAKPNYNYGQKRFAPGGVQFESDIDKALFIVAQDSPSKRDADFMNFLKKVFPDKEEAAIRGMGKRLRQEVVKPLAKDTPAGEPLKVEKSYDKVNDTPTPEQQSTETTAQELAKDLDVTMITTPEERADLAATSDKEAASLAVDQVKKLRDTVVDFAESTAKRLDAEGDIAKDDSDFQRLRNRAYATITDMKRKFGELSPESSDLIKSLNDIVKKVGSRDPAKVKDALNDLNKLDSKLSDAKVLAPEDISKQVESLKSELAKAEKGLKTAKKPETIQKLTDKKAQLESDISGLSEKLPKDFNPEVPTAAPAEVPTWDDLHKLIASSENLTGKDLGMRKAAIIKNVYDRAKGIQDFQRSVSPTTGEVVNTDAQLMQQYNEQMAKTTAMTPAQFLEEQSKTLDGVLQQIKGLPGWEEGGRSMNRLLEIEEQHKAAMEKADGFEKGAKQALACGLQGDL